MADFLIHLKGVWYIILAVVAGIVALVYNFKYRIPNIDNRVKELEDLVQDGIVSEKDLKNDSGLPLFQTTESCDERRSGYMKVQKEGRNEVCKKVDKLDTKLTGMIREADNKRERAKTDLSTTVQDLSVSVATLGQQVEDFMKTQEALNVKGLIETMASSIAKQLKGV